MKILLALIVAVFAFGITNGALAQGAQKKGVKKTCVDVCQDRQGTGSRNAYSKCMSRCASNRANR